MELITFGLICIVARSRRTFESKQNLDDDRMSQMEEHLRLAKYTANESERKYEEVSHVLNFWGLF